MSTQLLTGQLKEIYQNLDEEELRNNTNEEDKVSDF